MRELYVPFNTAIDVYFYMTNTATYSGGEPVTGETGLYCYYKIDTGSVAYSGATVTEVDSTYYPGVYKAACTSAVTNGDVILLNIYQASTGKRSIPVILYTDKTVANLPQTRYDKAINDLVDTEVAAIKTVVDSVLVDTGTTLPATLTTIDNFIDTEVAAIKTAVDAILVDTGTDGVVLANDAITAAKIADDAITADQLADNAITAGKIASNAITAGKIASNAITSGKLAADSVGASQLAADAVTEIATGIAAKALTAATSLPGSTPTIDQALMWLYHRFRYKVTQTSTQQKMHESDGDVLGTSTISDDGTTVTQGDFS